MKIGADVQWNRAGRLLRERQIAPEQHVLLQENVATYLTHLGEDSVQDGRWVGKLKRDLQHPYSDSEVLQHVDELQADLKTRLSELPVYPQRIYVTGSFVRGRLGENSDLDTIFVFPEEARNLDLGAALREEGENRLSPFAVFSDQPGMLTTLLTMSGARLQLQPEVLNEPGSLRREYEQTLAARGIHVDGETCRRDEDVTPERRETSPVLEWLTSRAWSESNTHEQKWDRLQGSSWKSRARRCALGVAGSLAGLPGVSWALDQLVDQSEKRLPRREN